MPAGRRSGDRAVHVHPEVVFRMTGVSVANARIGAGANGAGLRNDGGDVEITDASFQYNQAHNGAGLMNVGRMIIRRTLIWGNEATDAGAGIRNDSSLEIYDSTIGGNQTAGPGGGIQNNGVLDLWNSTVTTNTATNRAAAIYNGYPLVGGTVRLRVNSSTIFANNVNPDSTEFPSTGGIYTEPGSPVLISNTILSGNGVNYSVRELLGRDHVRRSQPAGRISRVRDLGRHDWEPP